MTNAVRCAWDADAWYLQGDYGTGHAAGAAETCLRAGEDKGSAGGRGHSSILVSSSTPVPGSEILCGMAAWIVVVSRAAFSVPRGAWTTVALGNKVFACCVSPVMLFYLFSFALLPVYVVFYHSAFHTSSGGLLPSTTDTAFFLTLFLFAAPRVERCDAGHGFSVRHSGCTLCPSCL